MGLLHRIHRAVVYLSEEWGVMSDDIFDKLTVNECVMDVICSLFWRALDSTVRQHGHLSRRW